MKKLLFSLSCILVLLLAITGCRQKEVAEQTTEITTKTSTTTTEGITTTKEATTTESITTTEAATTTEANSSELEGPVASEDDEKSAVPVSAKGTFMGFADDTSVEILLSDSNKHQVFMVTDETVLKKLNDMAIGKEISFQYKPLKGQANQQIISVE